MRNSEDITRQNTKRHRDNSYLERERNKRFRPHDWRSTPSALGSRRNEREQESFRDRRGSRTDESITSRERAYSRASYAPRSAGYRGKQPLTKHQMLDYAAKGDFRLFFDAIKPLNFYEQANKLQYMLILIGGELKKLASKELPLFIKEVITKFVDINKDNPSEARFIATLLHRAGVIFQKLPRNRYGAVIKIESEQINTLLAQLQGMPDSGAQGISNTLYGVGRLAEAQGLNGVIEASCVNRLLEQREYFASHVA